MKITNYKIAITLVCFLLLSIGTVSAQIRFGAKAAIDVADHKISSDAFKAENRLGFTVGPTVEVKIPFTGLAVDGSLLYGHKEYKVTNESTVEGDIRDYNYISIPVNLKMRFGLVPGLLGGYVTAGPYADVKLSGGDFEIESIDEQAESTVEKFKSKGFAMGINAGIGVSVVSKLDVGVYYRCKLTDNYSSDDLDLGNFKDKNYQTWSIGATYFF